MGSSSSDGSGKSDINYGEKLQNEAANNDPVYEINDENNNSTKIVSVSVVVITCLAISCGLMIGVWCFCNGYNKQRKGHVAVNGFEDDEDDDVIYDDETEMVMVDQDEGRKDDITVNVIYQN